MDIIKVIDRDIEATKEQISEYLDYYSQYGRELTVDDLIDDVTNWDGEDINVSYEVGYLRALEVTKQSTFRFKLKSLLAKVKSVFAKKNRNNNIMDLNKWKL